ncbi:tetratricopeptide repeat protein [Actinoplanes sp. NPDC048988]|uniref:AfsR/SARP family transcriptional regulator n=1 Tax=Actinoplanes sp. NPDC048988 TaxID=3363901 RepID=UPI003718193C
MGRMWFTVLGPVRAWRDGAEIDLGAPQQRSVLAVLLARAGQPVSLAEIVDTLWWDDPPATAVNAVHRSVGLLRRALEPELAVRGVGRWLVRAGGGYRLAAGPDEVDLLRFRALIGEKAFAEALELWQGPAAATLPAEVRGQALFTALDREYEAAAAEAALVTGASARLVGAVELAADRAPLNESLQARLLLMLAGAGRPADARRRYDEARARLAADLGVEPGPELVAAARKLSKRPVTAQLPHALPGFSGRGPELAAALTLPDRERVGAISGMAGVGKTAFAVQLAHRVADRCPDGQLYLNLRGFGPGAAMDPADALIRLLGSLGVPAHQIPADLDSRAALYRSRLAGRRMLLLFDNARDTAQVRPLLPGTPGHVVLVTSRDRLAGLVVSDGARPIALGTFSTGRARELLAARLGAERIAAEPAAVDKIIGRCGGLPLALAIVAARAATQPGLTMAELAGELDVADRLDQLTTGDPDSDVRTVFSWSYRILADGPARLFRLFGLHPGADITVAAAASLVGLGPAEARTLLADLVRAGLFSETSPGRYGAHDLLHAYAADLAGTDEAAQSRLLDHYLHTAHRAAMLLAPGLDPLPLAEPAPGSRPEKLTGEDQALGWLTAEYRVLRALVDRSTGLAAWRLAWTLDTFQRRQDLRHDQVTTRRTALAAAKQLDDPLLLADSYRDLGHALARADRADEARAHFTYAIERYTELGEKVRQAHVERGIGYTYVKPGQYDRVLDHYLRAESLYLAAGHRAGLAKCLNENAFLQARLGRPEQARQRCEQALVVFRELGDRHGEAATLDTLGLAHTGLGRHEQAVECFTASAELCVRIGDRRSQAEVLSNLGDAHAGAGRPDKAVAAWRSAVAVLDDLGRPEASGVRKKIDAHTLPTDAP